MVTHNRIKELRTKKGLSQKEFAKAFSEFIKGDENVKPVSYATISRWERGENEPKLETWIKLADFFDVPVSYLQGFGSLNYEDKNQLIDRLAKRFPELKKSHIKDTTMVPVTVDELGFKIRDAFLFMFDHLYSAYLADNNKNPLEISKEQQRKLRSKVDNLDEKDIEHIVGYVGMSLYLLLDGTEKEKEELYSILDKFHNRLWPHHD